MGEASQDATEPGASSPALPESVLRRLAALKETYGRQLGEKLAAIAQEVEAASADRDPARQALARARDLAHKLHGSAGIHGFAAVGKAAERLDLLLRAAVAGREAISPEFWDQVKAALSEARAACQQTSGNVSGRETSTP